MPESSTRSSTSMKRQLKACGSRVGSRTPNTASALRDRGDVMTKNEILQSVWDLNYDGDDHVDEVYVGYLRRKIDRPCGRRAITTVCGAGYRLEGDGG